MIVYHPKNYIEVNIHRSKAQAFAAESSPIGEMLYKKIDKTSMKLSLSNFNPCQPNSANGKLPMIFMTKSWGIPLRL